MADRGLVKADLAELMRLGELLDERPEKLGGVTVAGFLAEALLKIRSRSGAMVPLRANRVQEEFERRRGQKNVVLKARQMGISTWGLWPFIAEDDYAAWHDERAGCAYAGCGGGDLPDGAPVCGVFAGVVAGRSAADLEGKCTRDSLSGAG